MSPAFLIDPTGKRIPLADRVTLGRSLDVDLQIQDGGVARKHARLTRRLDDRYDLEDLGSTNGTFVNGDRVVGPRLLEHGDVIDLMQHRFRFESEPPRPAPLHPIAASIADVWHDEAALQVRIDELLERGDPLAARLASGVDVPLPELSLGDVIGGDFVVSRWRGFVRSLRFRDSGTIRSRQAIFTLLSSEAARLLEELVLPEYSPWLGLEGFNHATLTRLRIGPFFDEGSADLARASLAGRTFPGLPRLQPPEVEVYRRAWLEFPDGGRRELSAGRREVFATCSVDRQDTRWVVLRKDTKTSLKVNGVERYSVALLPGDVVRAGPLEFTLRAE